MLLVFDQASTRRKQIALCGVVSELSHPFPLGEQVRAGPRRGRQFFLTSKNPFELRRLQRCCFRRLATMDQI